MGFVEIYHEYHKPTFRICKMVPTYSRERHSISHMVDWASHTGLLRHNTDCKLATTPLWCFGSAQRRPKKAPQLVLTAHCPSEYLCNCMAGAHSATYKHIAPPQNPPACMPISTLPASKSPNSFHFWKVHKGPMDAGRLVSQNQPVPQG